VIGVEQGILLAIALSLIRHVRHSYRPHTMVVTEEAVGHWIPTSAQPGLQTRPGLIVYRFGADLFYANADRFADEARELIDSAPQPVQWFVVDASAITDIDFSAARTLRDLLVELTSRNIEVVFGRVNPSLRADMERHGIVGSLGEGRIFASLHEAVAFALGHEAAQSSFRRDTCLVPGRGWCSLFLRQTTPRRRALHRAESRRRPDEARERFASVFERSQMQIVALRPRTPRQYLQTDR
jgi:hypothetical protein